MSHPPTDPNIMLPRCSCHLPFKFIILNTEFIIVNTNSRRAGDRHMWLLIYF